MKERIKEVVQVEITDFDIEVLPENAPYFVPEWAVDGSIVEFEFYPTSNNFIDDLAEHIALCIQDETGVDEPNGDFEVMVSNVEFKIIVTR
jgi:hypothetical protein